MRLGETVRFKRRNLPHWEVRGGRYFVTVRCADSLPADAIARLGEIEVELRAIEPRSEQFAALQRRHFAAVEKYLDAGRGGCVLRQPQAAEAVVAEFEALKEWDVEVPHYTHRPSLLYCHCEEHSDEAIQLDRHGALRAPRDDKSKKARGDWYYTTMPNHWHALIVPRAEEHSFSEIVKRLKGRSARAIRATVGGSGAVWQREWFDRWVRDDAEWEKCVAYIRNNPMKAGIVKEWSEHRWTK